MKKEYILIPIIIGGVLYWIFRDPRSEAEKLSQEKRDLRKRSKQVSKRLKELSNEEDQDAS